MSFAMRGITVPAYLRGLGVMGLYLHKAAAFAEQDAIDPAALVQARLAPDMLPLSGQVQRTSDTAKNAIARLLDVDAPRFEDNEVTLDELRARVDRTREWIESVDVSALDASSDRRITLGFASFKRDFTREEYVLEFALPNFYFHLATAHAILRREGVVLGKLDYLGATL